MTVQERLRQLISILPPRADLVRMLDGEAETIAALDRDLTVEEVAEKVGRAVSTVRTWLIAGDRRGYKLNGKSWRIPQTALRKYLDAQTTVSVPDRETKQTRTTRTLTSARGGRSHQEVDNVAGAS